MGKQNGGSKTQIYVLSAVIALIQVVDIVVHVSNDMIEPIRLLSNGFIFVWLGIFMSGRFNHIAWRMAGLFVGVYFLLNAIFVTTEGFTNPENGDQFRTALFVFVAATIALSAWLTNTIDTRSS